MPALAVLVVLAAQVELPAGLEEPARAPSYDRRAWLVALPVAALALAAWNVDWRRRRR